MFPWICPECGRENDPEHKQCPRCEPSESGEAVLAGGAANAADAAEPEPRALDPEVLPPQRTEESRTRSTAPGSVEAIPVVGIPIDDPDDRADDASATAWRNPSGGTGEHASSFRAASPAARGDSEAARWVAVQTGSGPKLTRTSIRGREALAAMLPTLAEPPDSGEPPVQAPSTGVRESAVGTAVEAGEDVAGNVADGEQTRQTMASGIGISDEVAQDELPSGSGEILVASESPEDPAESLAEVHAGRVPIPDRRPAEPPAAMRKARSNKPFLSIDVAPVALLLRPGFQGLINPPAVRVRGEEPLPVTGLADPRPAAPPPAGRRDLPGMEWLAAEPSTEAGSLLEGVESVLVAGRAARSAGLRATGSLFKVRNDSFVPFPPPPRKPWSRLELDLPLAGPALPPELTSVTAAGVTVQRYEKETAKPRSGRPAWGLTFAVSGVVMVIVMLVTMWAIPGSSDADPVAAPPDDSPVQLSRAVTPAATGSAPAAASVSSPAVPADGEVEVTGLRFVPATGRPEEIHYLVVNHARAPLGDATVWVTLRSISALPGQPPLSRFSFQAEGLGPSEAREMVSPVGSLASAARIPSWSELRVEVQVVP